MKGQVTQLRKDNPEKDRNVCAFPSTRLSSVAYYIEVGKQFLVFGVKISFYSYLDVSVYGREKAP